MMALVWTDMTANYLTSSRSQLNAKFGSVTTYVQRQAQNIPGTSPVEVLTHNRVIRYHVPYAVLAIIFLAFYLVVILVALGMCITQKSTLHLLKSLLNQTSVGRAVVSECYKHEGSRGVEAKGMNTTDWIHNYGNEDIGIVKERKISQGSSKDSTPSIAQEDQHHDVDRQPESNPNLGGEG